jgi:undecaprenyl-diphosphatase
LASGTLGALRGGRLAVDPDAGLAGHLVVGTVPALAVGLLWHDQIETVFASPRASAALLLGTAVILVGAEVLAGRKPRTGRLTTGTALTVGVAQAVAILPGISRSGATIAAGLARGLDRTAAARFSFLLSTPVIIGAGVLELPSLLDVSGPAPVAAGVVAAFVVGYAAIDVLLRFVRTRSLVPFAVYVTLFGALALWRL